VGRSEFPQSYNTIQIKEPERIVLFIFCLRYWLFDVLSFIQVGVPLIVALSFFVAYAVSYPKWSQMSK
jgi:hypothetical protein